MLKAALTFAQIAGRDALAAPLHLEPAERHLAEAEAWLCRAQDASGDGGVSYGYSLRGGWRPSYPETSGYIATTFFRLARERDPSYFERAQRIFVLPLGPGYRRSAVTTAIAVSRKRAAETRPEDDDDDIIALS